MAARIVLVRHGPSAHVGTFRPIDRAGVLVWRGAYDSAGIRDGAQPPETLTELATHANHIVSSDLRRAIESAERLAPQRQVRVSKLLRETPLTIPAWPTRLPLQGWNILMTVAWSYRLVRGADAPEADRVRAAAAAEWLTGLVSDGSTAVVVTHGVVRRLVSQELLRRGWTNPSRRGVYRHWSAWTFSD